MIRKRIMAVMAGDSRYPFFSLATFLWCISLLYGAVVWLRRWLYKKAWLTSYRLPCMVISVGNLTAGGTGKTPLVIHLAGLIRDLGYRVAIISRGYKGQAQNKGAVVSDGQSLICDVRQSGDEPYLMATLLSDVPVVVGKDRYAAGRTAVQQFRPDVILLDDAYQHLRLRRDLNLLLLDARAPFGNTFMLPRGRLREPVSAMMDADAVIVTRTRPDIAVAFKLFSRPAKKRLPVFRSAHRSIVRGTVPADEPLVALDQLDAFDKSLRGGKLFAFSGLAENRGFFDTIEKLGGNIQGAMEFEDHYDYREDDVQSIALAAAECGATHLVTTDKDYVRFSGKVKFPLRLIVLGVECLVFDDTDGWKQFISERIATMLDRGETSR